jgi:anthranilate phosphoribosyltransferase
VGHSGIALQLASVLGELGSQHVVLVHSMEGLDEIGITGASKVTEFRAAESGIDEYSISPADFGLPTAAIDDLRGGDVATNVAITRSSPFRESVLRRTVTLMNAGAGIYAADAADTMAEGIDMAARAIDSGAALAKLDDLVSCTQRLCRTVREWLPDGATETGTVLDRIIAQHESIWR